MRPILATILLLIAAFCAYTHAARATHVPLVAPQSSYKGHFFDVPGGETILYKADGDVIRQADKVDLTERVAMCANCKPCCCGEKDPYGPLCDPCRECWKDYSYTCNGGYKPLPYPDRDDAAGSSSEAHTLHNQNSTSAGGSINLTLGPISINHVCSFEQSDSHDCTVICVKQEENCLTQCPATCSPQNFQSSCAAQCNAPATCQSTCEAQCNGSTLSNCIPLCVQACIQIDPCTQACIQANVDACTLACTTACTSTGNTCTGACPHTEALAPALASRNRAYQNAFAKRVQN